MSLSICACVAKANLPAVLPIIESQLKGKYKDLVIGESPADFAAFKSGSSSSGPCALIVETGMAKAVIKDLCDDVGAAARRVKMIYSITAGVDAYDLPNMLKEVEGIPIYNAQGCYSNILAEHVLFAMGYFNRQCWRLTKNRHEKNYERYNMKEISGQRAAIIGYGSIGQATGKLCAAMGMQVTGIRRTVDPANPQLTEKVDEHGVTIKGEAAQAQAIAEADFVVGVLPGTTATAHFFNKSVFASMKKSAVFINIGRGGTQKETDLVEALNNGTIAGAALDVFEVEPLPKESPIWSLPEDKILLSPHCADWTDQLVQHSANRFVKIYSQVEAGKVATEYLVDPKKGY